MEQLVGLIAMLLILAIIGVAGCLALYGGRTDLKINLEQHNLKHLLTPLWSAFGNTAYSSISPAALEKHGIGTSKERELLQDVLGINDRIA